MPSLGNRKISKRKIDRNGNALEFGMYRSRYCHLLVNQFHFLSAKGKMWRVQVASSESSSQCVELIFGNFLGLFIMKKYFATYHVGITNNSLLTLYIVYNGISGHVITSLY